LASLHEDMEMTEHDLDMDIWDLSQTARNIAEAWNDPTLRKQLEAERDSILSDIDLIRRTIVADEQAEVRRLQAERLALIKRRTAEDGTMSATDRVRELEVEVERLTRLAPLEVEVERLTRERDELKRSLERAEYLLSDLEEWEERTHREATVERLTRERDEARRDAECMRGNADDNYAKLQAAEARLARAREALEKASERLQLIGNHALTRAASWITTCAYAYADEARRVLADSEPAGRAAVEESGGERE
jgi:hypothetical protein